MGGMRDMLAPLLHWASSLHKATASSCACAQYGIFLAGSSRQLTMQCVEPRGCGCRPAGGWPAGARAAPALCQPSWRPVRATSIDGGVPSSNVAPRWVVGTSEREQGSNARPTWRWAPPGASCPLRSPLQLPPSSEHSRGGLRPCRWDVLSSVRSVGASGALLLSLGSVASVL